MATENPRVWFKSISLENVRSFGTKQTIYFTSDGTKDGEVAQWNVILGDNGTGKTTVLKGLCLGSGLYWSDSDAISLSRSREGVSISCSLVEGNTEITLPNFWLQLEGRRFGVKVRNANYEIGLKIEGKLLLCAYGAVRTSIALSPSESQKQSNVHNLFNDNSPLLNPEQWLIEAELSQEKEQDQEEEQSQERELSHEKDSNQVSYYDVVLAILSRLFRGEVEKIQSRRQYYNTHIYFKTHYGDVRLQDLSLGYRTLIAWMVDFAKGLFDWYPGSPDPLVEPAVCLVDEIDLHLHPKFQRSIIKFLTETFPNTQFIVTAHSPLVVQSAENANLILLKREGNETHVAQGIDVHSWRIDQILSSDLFGEISSRPPATEERMQRRRALLLQDERTEQENQELARLEEELGTLTAAESQEALKALELISKSLTH